MSKAIGRKLKKIRLQRGLSLAAAARLAGCSRVAWRNWETGRAFPIQLHKEFLERWTDGEVVAAEWPLNRHEAAIRSRMERAERDAQEAC